MTTQKVLSGIEVNNEIFFQVVEEGLGYKSNSIFVYYYPKHKQLVKQQFKKSFKEGIQLKNDYSIKISVLK